MILFDSVCKIRWINSQLSGTYIYEMSLLLVFHLRRLFFSSTHKKCSVESADNTSCQMSFENRRDIQCFKFYWEYIHKWRASMRTNHVSYTRFGVQLLGLNLRNGGLFLLQTTQSIQ